MAEYIERKKLEEAFDNADPDVCESYPDGCVDWGFGGGNVRDVIRSVPAADVAPVVLGHWKKDRDTIKCTVCGFGMFPNRYTFMHGVCVTDKKLPKYCENCGAKMGTTEEQSV